MQNRALVLGTAAALVFVVAACGDDDTTGVTPTPTQSTKIIYKATLTGAAERPTPVTSAGSGSFTGTYDPATGNMVYTVTYSGLGSNSTASHIHGPGTTEVAVGVILNFASGATPFTAGTPSGSFGGTTALTVANAITTTVSGDSLRKLMDAGLAYVNVHSQVFPAGELRGQIVKQP
jgi:hypothetical protein